MTPLRHARARALDAAVRIVRCSTLFEEDIAIAQTDPVAAIERLDYDIANLEALLSALRDYAAKLTAHVEANAELAHDGREGGIERVTDS